MKHGWPLKKVGELFDVQLGKMLSPKAKEGKQLPLCGKLQRSMGEIQSRKRQVNAFHRK